MRFTYADVAKTFGLVLDRPFVHTKGRDEAIEGDYLGIINENGDTTVKHLEEHMLDSNIPPDDFWKLFIL